MTKSEKHSQLIKIGKEYAKKHRELREASNKKSKLDKELMNELRAIHKRRIEIKRIEVVA